MNIGNNAYNLNIGNYSSNITIGKLGSIINLNGTIQGAFTLSNITNSSTIKTFYLNTNSIQKDANLAGIYIQEGGYTPGTSVLGQVANNEGMVEAAFIKTTNNRKSFKFRVPDSANVISLNISQWTLPNTIDNGILVIKKSPIISNQDLDSDILYNALVSSYDISNILYRDKNTSTEYTQVIPTNISLSGNLSINKRPSDFILSALDISGNITHSNGWITQF
jgi:hypothetical protein